MDNTTKDNIELIHNKRSSEEERYKLINNEKPLPLFYYQEEWVEYSGTQKESNNILKGNIILFDINSNLKDSFNNYFNEINNDSMIKIHLVKPGKSYCELGNNEYQINSQDQNDYSKLITNIKLDDMPTHIIHTWSRDSIKEDCNIFDLLDQGIYSIFYLIKELMNIKNKFNLIYLHKGYTAEVQPQFSSVGSFLRTLNIEKPNFVCKSISVNNFNNLDSILNIILKESIEISKDIEIYYDENNKRFVRGYKPYIPIEHHKEIPSLKDDGVYIITGGTGSIGLIIAQYIASKVRCKIVLTGRSILSEEKEYKINKIRESGTEIIYIQSDINIKESVKKLIENVKSKFNEINGIIHAAGVLKDSFLLKKTREEFDAVLTPKVCGTLLLDEMTRNDKLDFFVLFSSIAATLGNVGQADYCYANSFMDYYAKRRENMVNEKKRYGKSISINWPLWKNGGMKIHDNTVEWLKENVGLFPLSSVNGVKGFETAIQSAINELIIVEGEREKLDRLFISEEHKSKYEENLNVDLKDKDRDILINKVENFLKTLISKETKLVISKIESKQNFEKYGLDSVMIMSLNRKLRSYLGEVSQTLFYENQTINQLAKYLINNYEGKIIEKFGEFTKDNDKTEKYADIKSLTKRRFLNNISNTQKNRRLKKEEKENKNIQDDIAIIGLSGKYPMSSSLEEFWENLRIGKDCITEVPNERWDYRLYYDPDKNKKGKTYSKWGGFIDDVDKFDPLFFNISPREASYIDPQERIFLETAWHTIEDAGYTREKLSKDSVGVFVGVMFGQYQFFGIEESMKGNVLGLSSSYASIANRVSYCLNLKGPSMGIDTMCSSSLTAIHIAIQNILSGECDIAIAGGVNVIIHPNKYILLSQSNFPSSDGRCRSFGDGGDGYVPGEGTGAVLLKPLKKAIADGDRIYGVIKGSALNHGGKTNGYSVPNPNAQTSLIAKVLNKSGIDARTISYIEAHGTGTVLGDPIEITGLVKAVEKNTNDKQYCAIGSVKSNIGHTESAAGIAGLTKILLQMKNKELVPSIHSKKLNDNINFKVTPFVVQQELEEWKQPVIDGVTYPRRAGISSFGAGGSNAHIIIEEYIHNEVYNKDEDISPQLIVLSAKNEDSLKAYSKELLTFLNKEDNIKYDYEVSLREIAYTLQIGREEMSNRLAVIVYSIEELKEKLAMYLKNEYVIENFYLGKNIKQTENVFQILEESEGQEYLSNLIKKQKLIEIAKIWINGCKINFNELHGNRRIRKINLPTYPFAKERYWIPQEGEISGSVDHIGTISKLHPMIDKNISTLDVQKFATTLSEKEFYISDHVIDGKTILPGVVYIEMARAAGELSGLSVTKIKDILWTRPIIVKDSSCEVQISLYPEKDYILYEVSTHNSLGDNIINSQGILITDEKREDEILDIGQIQEKCTTSVSRDAVYEGFERAGFKYGRRFKTITKVYCGKDELLAYLELPDYLSQNAQEFGLHPAIFDGALQAVSGLIESQDNTVFLPYSIGEVEIIKHLNTNCYVYVTRITDTLEKKYNIDIMDEKGNVILKVKDFLLRAKNMKTSKMWSTKFYTSNWEKKLLNSNEKEVLGTVLIFETGDDQFNQYKDIILEENKKCIIVKKGEKFRKVGELEYEVNPTKKEDYTKLLNSLKETKNIPSHIIHSWSNNKDRSHEEGNDVNTFNINLQKSIYSLFYICQGLLEQKINDNVKMLYTYKTDAHKKEPQYEAINSFLKTISIENSKFSYKTLSLHNNSNLNNKDLLMELKDDSLEVMYKDGVRYVKLISEIKDVNKKSNNLCIKENGVYIITGGAGGLGFIFAEYLAKRYKAKIVLTGRSDLNNNKSYNINKLKQYGGQVIYIKADVSKKKDVEKIVYETKSKFNNINGIIHSAGVKRDSYLINKKEKDLEEVFAAKIYGTYWIDEITKNEKLDFFVLFSSVTAVYGNAGQSDYAYANSFMDSFAKMREEKYKSGDRYGKTISINWPLWLEGGMKVDVQTEKLIRESYGLKLLETDTGINAFEISLMQEYPNFMVLEKNKNKMNIGINERTTKEVIDPKLKINIDEKELLEKVQNDLIGIISQILIINKEEIRVDIEMSEFGFDSITFTELGNIINNKFNIAIVPSIFYEHGTLLSLVKYLINEFRESFNNHYFKTLKTMEKKITSNKLLEKSEKQLNLHRRYRAPKKIDIKLARDIINQPIAIIGINGIMPGSNNTEEFWENLIGGRNLITEIPIDRWNWKNYYGDPLSEVNKTNIKWGGFMNDVDKFDPLFFGISPKEAELMDPQQRIFLETVWGTIEDAGYNSKSIEGNTGIFVGVGSSDYRDIINESNIEIQSHISTGLSHSVLVNRISYLLNLRGPSEPIDTACSSSLTAVHRAVESIQLGHCDMAIAGGINVIASPTSYIALSKTGMLSKDGRNKTFDKSANGYVRGEGSGAVLLKPLNKAIKDQDNIYAVIKGSAINHGGHVNSLTTPNPNAQAEVIIEAWEKSGIDPTTVEYIEAHGTGTSLGDPIEINGLKKAFKKLYSDCGKNIMDKPNCGIGSVKTNIGHLESAAGIAGLLKVILAIKNEKIPATININEINPYIQLKESPFYIVNSIKKWKKYDNKPRRAGISSFGYGGTNAHIVIEEYKAEENNLSIDDEPQIIVLSAKNKDRLKEYAYKIVKFIDNTLLEENNRDKEHQILANIKKDLVEMTSEIINVSIHEINNSDKMDELGFDIVKLKEFYKEINIKYNLQDSLFINDYMSIHEIALLLMEKYIDNIVQYYPYKVANRSKKTKISLEEIAYTLQTGRDSMSTRLAFVAKSIDDLKGKLNIYASGNTSEDIHQSVINATKYKNEMLVEGEEGEIYIKALIENKKLDKIAQIWVCGGEINWKELHNDKGIKKISVPTYPFARQSYWISEVSNEEYFVDEKSTYVRDEVNSDEIVDNNTKKEFQTILQNINCFTCDLLGVKKEDIDFDSNLDEYGMNSILMVQLANKIKNQYENLTSYRIIFEENTIRDIAKYIYKDMSLNNTVKKVNSMNRKQKTKELSKNVIDNIPIEKLDGTSLITNNILINGVTGLLGGRTLKEYMESTNNKLYCLVRGKNKDDGKERILKMLNTYEIDETIKLQYEQRIIPVIGDITKNNLGLDEELYNKLANTIDMVVHIAGKISLHGSYEEVKEVNVNGTRNMIKFALKTNQKYFIHTSTIAIMGDRLFKNCPPYTEKDFYIGQEFKNMGYEQSKFEAEEMVRSSSKDGLKWIIARAGYIMGDSSNGNYPFGITNVPGLFYDYIKTAIDIKMFFNSPLYFDVTPVDYISKGLVYISTEVKKIYETYHLNNPNTTTLNDIMSYVKKYGYKIDIINFNKFIDSIKSVGNNYHSMTTELMLLNSEEEDSFGYSCVDSTYTKEELEKVGIICPKVDEKLIDTYLNYCIKQGYLKKPTKNTSKKNNKSTR
jgi:polyketide synthase PksN